VTGLKSIILFTADPWESAMPQLRVIRPAYHAKITVICGYDRTSIFKDRIGQADLVVIERDFPRIQGFTEVIAEARRLNKPIVYEIDDMLFEIPESNLHHITYLDALLRMMQAARLADAAIVSTPKLKEYVGQINAETWSFPYFLDDSLWPLTSEKSPSAPGVPVIIGYMGGHTHRFDLETIAPVLEGVLDKYGNRVRLRFWGGPPPESLHNRPEVDFIPMDILDYAQFATFYSNQSCDIFVAPLQNDGFNQYKSHNKFLEYSSFGIPGIYSLCESYKYIVEQNVTGFLADSKEEWFQCLVQLIDNPDLRLQMGKHARESVKKNWLLSAHAVDWLVLYEKILTRYQANPGKPVSDEDVILKLLARVQGYQNQLKETNFQLQGRLNQAAEIEKALSAKINEQEDYFQELKRTRSWRLIESLQSLRKTFLPVGGKGEALLKKSYRMVSRSFGQKK
jgi:glycosyltransferase involved in cell wall biosynthesis